MDKAELEKNYLETIYSVFIDSVKVDCKVGELAPPEINQLVAKEQSAVVLTAWNPKSQTLTTTENGKRNNELLSYLQQRFTVLKAFGQGNDVAWPGEESFFIVGLNKEDAEQLAAEYEQNAYVWFEVDKPVTLEFSRIWRDSF